MDTIQIFQTITLLVIVYLLYLLARNEQVCNCRNKINHACGNRARAHLLDVSEAWSIYYKLPSYDKMLLGSLKWPSPKNYLSDEDYNTLAPYFEQPVIE